MKKFNLSALVILTMIVIFLNSSCNTQSKFLASPVVPSARGAIKVKKDNNKNHLIQIQIFNLASAKLLQPAKTTYVVWMCTDQDEIKNLGQIKTSGSIFSKTLKASFKTVTSFKPIKIFITAENKADIQEPIGQIVLTTDNF